MAIDLTADPQPAFASSGALTTTALEIRCKPHTQVTVKSAVALYIFNGVADGGTVPASARLALSADEAAAGASFVVGGPVAGQKYGTLCVAAQSGEDQTVYAFSTPPTRSNA
jgi:hypothetical protein